MQRSTSSGGPWTNIAFPTTLGYTATGLTNGTPYYFRVAAHNAAGWGATGSVAGTPLTVPGMIPWCNAFQLPVYGVRSIQVQWQAPGSNGGSPIEYYDIEFRLDGHYHVAYNLPADQISGALEVYDSGIYEVRVFANNAAGDGAYCSTSVVVY